MRSAGVLAGWRGAVPAPGGGGGTPPSQPPRRRRSTCMADANRLIYLGSACLAASVLADSAGEHFRAGVYNPVMLAGPALAAATVAASARARGPSRGRRVLYAASVAGGLIGFAFHARNVLRREGGAGFLNLFYGAPVGAPLGLTLAGAFGLAAEMNVRPRLLAAAGLIGTAAEAGVLHFRGSFHDPLMYAPAVLPPIAAASIVAAIVKPSKKRVRTARVLAGATAALGIAGVVAHAIGVGRYMGGWRNWSQNLFAGPPVPAPPSFTGIALAALGALRA